jgi:pterin-4a-carbinolamine dehydratase
MARLSDEEIEERRSPLTENDFELAGRIDRLA